MRNLGFVLITLMLGLTISAQEIRLKRTPMLDRLYATKHNISEINDFPYYQINNLSFFETRIKIPYKHGIKLIVNDSGLYLLTNGSGFVYKAIKQENDSLRFKAVDSTFYVSYNAGSIKISYKNELYSFGGYGFWHTNGYLLQFKPGKDWQRLKH